MAAGTLFLIPTTLGDSALATVIPQEVQQRVRMLDYFVAENPKSARAYLKQVGTAKPLQELHIATLNEHTPDAAVAGMAAPLRAGHDVGMMSEAGCPGIADPGAKLVLHAHRHAIRVVPLVGPSSILLALMASGLNGQSFVFHGYLPVADVERERTLRQLEKQSRRLKQTQIFIETPYRNQKLLHGILAACASTTLLCVAAEISLAGEDIRTMSVAAWKKHPPQLDRRPALFLLLGV
ncbi:MAG: SAM-dependent methyltransferase [Betaproteobacteria bacterium RIFCSPLOWO2_12_FULL_64_23]|nr:MAG: SAM-dependent methyltransferase [Betaproteobacteria bacterium RIFCSPLOWO2_12_FULL_64_23]